MINVTLKICELTEPFFLSLFISEYLIIYPNCTIVLREPVDSSDHIININISSADFNNFVEAAKHNELITMTEINCDLLEIKFDDNFIGGMKQCSLKK